MSSADPIIAALNTGHDQLLDLVGDQSDLGESQLTTPTLLDEWTVAQVLSHLGSGAEITRNTLGAALTGKPNPGLDANKEVWAVWDAKSAADQRSSFIAANQALLNGIDKIDTVTRDSLRVDLGFLPAPVDLATALTFRLNEFALHSWDIRAFLDDDAVIEASAVPHLLPMLPMMLGFLAKPEHLGREVTLRVDLSDPAQRFGLVLGAKEAQVTDVPEKPDGTLALPAEAWLRLVTGRLRREYTPEDKISVEGSVSLTDLRQVFPGF